MTHSKTTLYHLFSSHFTSSLMTCSYIIRNARIANLYLGLDSSEVLFWVQSFQWVFMTLNYGYHTI